MGRPSKLSDKQWAEVEKRLLAGEKPADLAKEFGVNRAQLTRRFSQPLRNVKQVANQIVQTEVALKSLSVAQQVQAINLADQLRSISEHLAGAAQKGAMTAHRLSTLANTEVQKVDDVDPLQSLEALKGVAALTRLANDSAQIGMNLLSANKETVKQINDLGSEDRKPKTIDATKLSTSALREIVAARNAEQ